MSKIVFTIFLTTFFIVFSFYFYYHKDTKNRKLFRQSISSNIFFLTFIAPLVAASLFTFVISLIFREGDTEKFFKSDVVTLLALFYLYGVYSAAQGIHALAKTFKFQAVQVKDQKLLYLIRFFHGPFSHYASNISISLIGAFLLIFNTNHPARETLTGIETFILFLCGIVLGLCLASTYVISNTSKFMRWAVFLLFLTLLYIELTSKEIIFRAPMSLTILTMFTTSLIIFFLDIVGPKKNWFIKIIDDKFESVDTDWRKILQEFSK